MNHSFDVDVASKVGVNAAIIFQDMGFWCEHSRTNRKNYHDGLYWTYNSISALGEHYPYMSTKAIRTALQKLIDAEMLTTGNFNAKGWDRTLWYALTQKGESIFRKGKMDYPKKENGSSQNGEPIPYTITDSIPNNIKGAKARCFTPPTLSEVQDYAKEKGFTTQEFSPSGFVDFYQSKGWKVGKDRMKDWKAAARGWVTRYRQEHPAPEPEKPSGLYNEDLSPKEYMKLMVEAAERDREEARQQGLL